MRIREEYRAPLAIGTLIGGVVAAQMISDRITRLLTQGGLLLLVAAQFSKERPTPPQAPVDSPPVKSWKRFTASNGKFQLSSDQVVSPSLEQTLTYQSTLLTIDSDLEPIIKGNRLEAISCGNHVYLIVQKQFSPFFESTYNRTYQISLKEGETIDNLRYSVSKHGISIELVGRKAVAQN